MSDPKFEIGDKVSAWGIEGVVEGVTADESPCPILVRLINGLKSRFMRDGRHYDWHLEPTLKLIEKARKEKPKIKAYLGKKDYLGFEKEVWVLLFSENELIDTTMFKRCPSADKLVENLE